MKQDLREIAGILLKLISQRDVADTEYEAVAAYFYGGHGAADAASFRPLADVVVQQLPNNRALQRLARDNRRYLGAPMDAPPAWAREFIDRYIDGLGAETLFSQPIMVGYAPRIKGSPFDVNAAYRDGFPGWLLLYSAEGTGLVNTGMRQVAMQPGHLALFEPGAVLSYERARSSTMWSHFWVTFQAPAHWREWLDWPRIGPQLGYLETPAEEQPRIRQAFELLLENFTHAGPMAVQLNHALLEVVILRCRQLAPEAGGSRIDPRVDKARQFIESHYNESFTIADVAAAAATSGSTLAHLFKAHTGSSVLGWRDEKRMTHAARLLRNTQWPVSRIAAECGYADAPFFTRTFKRFMGVTPRQYRRA